jgi:hypothetical protein
MEQQRNLRLPVGKLEAAERQLNTAIRLHFQGSDPLSIHTLAAAAQQILVDIGNSRGIEGVMYSQETLDRVRPEKRAEWLKATRAPQNFLKHADKDGPEAVLDIHLEFYELLLFDCVQLLRKLKSKDDLAREVHIYKFWFHLKRPDYLAHPLGKEMFKQFLKAGADPGDLESFLSLINSKGKIPVF